MFPFLPNGPSTSLLVERDLTLLKHLSAREPLAISRKGLPTIRANVRWPSHERRPPARALFSAVAPIVILGEQLPEKFRPLRAKPPPSSPRLARKHTELKDKQFLATVPAFRCLRKCREHKRAESF
jgi:hypothetical protein